MRTLLGWADRSRRLGVWANADYPRDAPRAREFGAEGIGLCRTEHMFMEEERLPIVQQMILAARAARARQLGRSASRLPADARQTRKAVGPWRRAGSEAAGREERWPTRLAAVQVALDQLCRSSGRLQGAPEGDGGLPVIIRLLDPPLHEFLPKYDELLVEVDRAAGARATIRPELAENEELLEAVDALRESNPMLGLRGCRLGLLYPGDQRDAGAGDPRGGASS